MTMTLQAVFENGVFRPVVPLSLPEGQQAQVVVEVIGTEGKNSLETPSDSRKAEELSDEEYEAMLDSLCEGPDLPILPDSAYTREGIYEGG
jgi:predicted DNA-binding antitoxin AbrB/MazE fold protein